MSLYVAVFFRAPHFSSRPHYIVWHEGHQNQLPLLIVTRISNYYAKNPYRSFWVEKHKEISCGTMMTIGLYDTRR